MWQNRADRSASINGLWVIAGRKQWGWWSNFTNFTISLMQSSKLVTYGHHQIVAWEMLSYSSSRATWKWQAFWGTGTCQQTLLSRTSQRCLIGDMSGEYYRQLRAGRASWRLTCWQCAGRYYLDGRSDDWVKKRAQKDNAIPGARNAQSLFKLQHPWWHNHCSNCSIHDDTISVQTTACTMTQIPFTLQHPSWHNHFPHCSVHDTIFVHTAASMMTQSLFTLQHQWWQNQCSNCSTVQTAASMITQSLFTLQHSWWRNYGSHCSIHDDTIMIHFAASMMTQSVFKLTHQWLHDHCSKCSID